MSPEALANLVTSEKTAPETANSGPSLSTMRAAAILATRAPSIGGSQQWHCHSEGSTVHLASAGHAQRIGATSDADALVDCGAALHRLHVALAAFGWAGLVRRFPKPICAAHVASIDVTAAEPSDEAISLVSAMSKQTDKQNPICGPSRASVNAVAIQVARAGGLLVPTNFSGRYSASPELHMPAGHHVDHDIELTEQPQWFALATRSPGQPDILLAGEALSAAVLTASRLGLRYTVRALPKTGIRLGASIPHLMLQLGSGETVTQLRTPTQVGHACHHPVTGGGKRAPYARANLRAASPTQLTSSSQR